MPVVYPSEIIEIVANWQLPNGSAGASVWHGRTSAPGDPALVDCQAAADWVTEWFDTGGTGDPGKGFFNENLTLVSATATARGLDPAFQATSVSGVSGTATGIAAPNESAIVSTHYTQFVGKSFRGRTYWPGYDPDTLGDDGLLNPTSLANWTDAIANFVLGFTTQAAENIDLCVWSRTLDQLNSIQSSVVRSTPHHISKRNS